MMMLSKSAMAASSRRARQVMTRSLLAKQKYSLASTIRPMSSSSLSMGRWEPVPTTTALGETTRRAFSSPPPPPPPNLGNIFQQAQQQGQQQSFLEQFTVDLTEQVREQDAKAKESSSGGSKLMDPIIGRHDEIRRCLQILARRTKNNPVLIGQAGVGKTAIAEGLAQRIVSGQVPESMQNKRVLSLDVAGLVSGAMMRGQFEERIQGVLKEVKETEGEVILFVDELHTIVGAGNNEGGMDMSNLLKPALARGELQMLGATTLDEYRRIEKDAALARRFQSVYVKEPNMEDTLSILRGLKPTYELHHAGLRIKDEALVAAVTLSDRYITDRYQPDKAIDLIDEACSRLRLEQESKPEILWTLERDLMTKQIELTALQGEDDDDEISTTDEHGTIKLEDADGKKTTSLTQRRKHVEQEIKTLETRIAKITKRWQQERQALTRVKDLKEELAQAQRDMLTARSQGDYAKAGELLHATIPNLQHELHDLEEKDDVQQQHGNKKKKSKQPLLADAVTAEAVATIVSRHTGIPVTRLTGNESSKLLHMEDVLREAVVGQDHALEAVSNCVRLARTGLHEPNRTLGNFLFVGPSGVGKTELCKQLANFLFDDENALTRLDMSEFSEKHTVSRLIGSPPGYVGYEQGGVLTESVRRRPYQVLLLDEFEKGHPEVWNLLLQLFDDGRLSDSHGNVVDFSNVLVVMTSNMGASILSELPGHIRGSEPEVQESILEVVRKTLTPELLNRIDETVVFHRLQREHMHQIVDMGLAEIADRMQKQTHGNDDNMQLDVSDAAKACLAERGFDVRYGARPLKRTLAKEVLHPLSRMVLEGSIREGDVVQVRTRGEGQNLQKEGKAPFGWSSRPGSTTENRNDVVILKNHEPHEEDIGELSGADDDDSDWEDDLHA